MESYYFPERVNGWVSNDGFAVHTGIHLALSGANVPVVPVLQLSHKDTVIGVRGCWPLLTL